MLTPYPKREIYSSPLTTQQTLLIQLNSFIMCLGSPVKQGQQASLGDWMRFKSTINSHLEIPHENTQKAKKRILAVKFWKYFDFQ